MESKDTKKFKQIADENKAKERAIALQWLEFSRTDAWKDFETYARNNIDMLTSYAMEGVMPSPVRQGEEIVLNGEKSLSLLQNARGCDIILSYAVNYIKAATEK